MADVETVRKLSRLLGVGETKSQEELLRRIRDVYGTLAERIAKKYMEQGSLEALRTIHYTLKGSERRARIKANLYLNAGIVGLSSAAGIALLSLVVARMPELSALAALITGTSTPGIIHGHKWLQELKEEEKSKIVGAAAVIHALEALEGDKGAEAQLEQIRGALLSGKKERILEHFPHALGKLLEQGIKVRTLPFFDVLEDLEKIGWVTGMPAWDREVWESIKELERVSKGIRQLLEQKHMRAGEHPGIPEEGRKLIKLLGLHNHPLPADAPREELARKIIEAIRAEYGYLSAAYVALRAGNRLGLSRESARRVYDELLGEYHAFISGSLARLVYPTDRLIEGLNLGRVHAAVEEGIPATRVPAREAVKRSEEALKVLREGR